MPDAASNPTSSRLAMFGWLAALLLAIGIPFAMSGLTFRSICILFALYATIALMWRLIIYTAGISSFATLVTVGAGGYAAAYCSVHFGFNWPLMLLVATAVGAVSGLLIALPTLRLRGVYFALFTFALVELVRATVVSSRMLGTSEGISNARAFVPPSIGPLDPQGVLINYYAVLVLLIIALIVSRLVDKSRLGLRILTARESEPFAIALGIDMARARFQVFVISSAVLGLAGGCYAAVYRGISPSIFGFNLLVLLLAMMIVGGIHSYAGVLVGAALLLFIDQWYLDTGATRLIVIGLVMLLAATLSTRGLVGLPRQLREYLAAYRARKAVRVSSRQET